MDFNYIFQLIAKEQRSFIAKYYGVAKIKRQTAFGKEIEEKSIRFADNLRKIKNCLSKQNIEYHATGNLKVRDRDECKRCGAKDYKMQEKGVDVGLAVDLVKDVLEKEVDHIILISSDTDLIPAIKIAKENKIEITYVALSKQITKSLTRLANNTVIIKPISIAEAYARSL